MELEVKDSTQRILDAGEALFMDRGYSAITLRDIADELGIKQASLYYHFPAGKEQLFVAMAERLFERHREGLEQALGSAPLDLRAPVACRGALVQFAAAGQDVRYAARHIPALSRDHVERLEGMAREAMYLPLRRAFVGAQERGEIRPTHPDLLAGSFGPWMG